MESAKYPCLDGKTVLVTGGASGIGEAIVRHFLAQGSKVGFLDIDEAAAQRLLSDLRSPSLRFQRCDIRDTADLQRGIGAIREELGPITILVNNAAHDQRHEMEEVTSDYWDERMAVNLKHQFFAAQAVVPDMKAAGEGAIINMGSNSWMIGRGNMPAYTTAKAAIAGLTRSLARNLGPFGIRVCSVVPGWIMTERQEQLWLTPEGEAEMMDRQCLKRKLYPDDIARPILFFASREAGACTNQSYVIDGGWV